MNIAAIFLLCFYPYVFGSENYSNFTKLSFVDQEIRNLFNIPFSIFTTSQFTSQQCRQDLKKFSQGLNNYELWALKMLDATAKVPSGILSGNVNQFGDYDQCLSLPEAQYCLIELSFNFPTGKLYSNYKNLIHSHFQFSGDFNDVRHRVPNFDIIKWGVCFPSNCSSQDLSKLLNQNEGILVQVRSSMCKKSVDVLPEWSMGDYLARIFFGFVVILVIAGSFMYPSSALHKHNSNQCAQLLAAFSIQRNWEELTKNIFKQHKEIVKKDENHNGINGKKIVQQECIQSIDGIRALSALSLLMCHKSTAAFYNPYINRSKTSENLAQPWSVIGRTAYIYTDSFLLLSGFLIGRSLISDLKKNNRMEFTEKLLNRICRITPNIMAVILFCTYILPELNSGPMWPDVISHHAILCKQYMWRNLFYVHNHFGFENMCLPNTHQVGIDMQLFMISPLLVYLWWRNSKVGSIVAVTLAVISTILRGWVAYRKHLSYLVYFGISISKMFNTASASYILPSHRATIYIMGLLLAFVLEKYNFTLSKLHLTGLWFTAFASGLLAMVGPYHMAVLTYVYSPIDGAIYNALAPILWGFMLCWIIYASNRGYAGFFGHVMSWRGFQLFSKIAYSFYLVQFPIIFYFIGIQKNSLEFKLYHLIDFSEATLIIIISILLTLCIEMPFLNIKKILWSNKKIRK